MRARQIAKSIDAVSAGHYRNVAHCAKHLLCQLCNRVCRERGNVQLERGRSIRSSQCISDGFRVVSVLQMMPYDRLVMIAESPMRTQWPEAKCRTEAASTAHTLEQVQIGEINFVLILYESSS